MFIPCHRYIASPEHTYNEACAESFGEEVKRKPNQELVKTKYGFEAENVDDFYEYRIKSGDTWLEVTYIEFKNDKTAYIDIPRDVLCAILNKEC